MVNFIYIGELTVIFDEEVWISDFIIFLVSVDCDQIYIICLNNESDRYEHCYE